MILGIDTSSSRTSIALVDGHDVVVESFADGAMAHGEVIGKLVEGALADASITAEAITAVAVGTGPGPFTGLRVGLAFGRTFAWARSIPVWGVCSLDALAADCDAQEFTAVTDARRKEVYLAHYLGGVRQGEPVVTKPSDVDTQLTIGEGGFIYADHFPNHQEPRFPRAAQVALLAQSAIAAGKPTPLDAQYLRHPDVSL